MIMNDNKRVNMVHAMPVKEEGEDESMEKLLELEKTLTKKGYRVACYETREQAREALLSEIKDGESVGIGGSVTIREMDLLDALAGKNCPYYWHWLPEADSETRKKATEADVYLCSTNAITEKGELINIDGFGNRVAGMFYGPGRNIFVVGKNKIAVDYDAAIKRVKDIACPKNAVRLKLNTPCALTGKCADCASEQRFCNVTTIISYPPGKRDMLIMLVNEDLGY